MKKGNPIPGISHLPTIPWITRISVLAGGFRTNYCMELEKNQDGTYTFIDATGTPFIFREPDQYGRYTDCQGHVLKISKQGYVVEDESMSYMFDLNGNLTIVSGGGLATNRETHLTYDDQENLVSVSTQKAGYLESIEYQFVYSDPVGNAGRKVTQISVIQGGKEDQAITYHFQYDENGLFSMNGSNGKYFSCEIDPETDLLTRFGPDEITYMPDGTGIVASNVNGDYQYLYGNLQTIVDINGNMTLYRFDKSGHLIP